MNNKQFSFCFYAFIVTFGKGLFQSIGFYFEWCSVYIIPRRCQRGKERGRITGKLIRNRG